MRYDIFLMSYFLEILPFTLSESMHYNHIIRASCLCDSMFKYSFNARFTVDIVVKSFNLKSY